jgi:2,4-dienoyl-CoA reductase-like NADH-dependent reductase (Old Yellow Enzyme family)
MKTLHDKHKIGSLEINNRIGCPPMVCFHWYDSSGIVTDRNVNHYEAIAAGGTGLIIVEALCVSPEGKLDPSQLGIWDDRHIAGLQRITNVIHRRGKVALAQIHHGGLWSDSDAEPDRILGPSPNMPTKTGRPNLEITSQEIERIKRCFVNAALMAQKAGFDGVEVHGCHGYLLCDFFNPNINRRSDRYGQDTTLLAAEIVHDIRLATGKPFVVGIRLGGFEPTLAHGIAHAKAMEAAGVDFIDVSYGFLREGPDVQPPEGYLYTPPVYAAQEIKKSVVFLFLPSMAFCLPIWHPKYWQKPMSMWCTSAAAPL